MTDLTMFEFEGHALRTAELNGEPAVVLADIARILGYRDATAASRILRDHHKGYTEVCTPGGSQRMLVVTERGFNRLVIRSNAPNAEAVQDWLTDTVMPAIQRTGSYSTTPALTDDQIVQQALQITNRRVEELTAEVVELTPRAEAWDVMVSASGDYSVDEAAKVLSRDPNIEIGRNRLFSLMEGLHWVYRHGARRRFHAYQTAVQAGRLVERMSAAFLNARTGEMENPAPTIRVTAKGVDDLRKALTAEQEAS